MATARERSGRFDTPVALADELARRVAAAAPGASVLDPACGTGELLLAANRAGIPAGALHGIEIDPGRAEEARRRLSRAIGAEAALHVHTRDALGPGAWPARTAIVANPPWVSYSGRQAARRQGSPGESLGGWPSLHGEFLARIAQHVARERTHAVVLAPESLCHLPGYGEVRRAVTGVTRLVATPRSLGEDAFPGVLGPAVLLELGPRSAAGSGTEDPWQRAAPEERRLLQALEAYPRLPPGCFRDPGVHTGNAARRLLLPLDEASPSAVLREGRDLTPYRLGQGRLALDLSLERSDELRFRYAALERYRSFPVLLRQTAARPIAALHAPAAYFRNSLLACAPPAELDPAFCVGVLNGPVAAAWHRLSFADARQRSFPQVKVGHLRTLPFPFVARAANPALHDSIANAVRAATKEARKGDSPRFRDLVRAIEALVTAAYGTRFIPPRREYGTRFIPQQHRDSSAGDRTARGGAVGG